MKKILFALTFSLAALISCDNGISPSGIMAGETRNITGFNEISASTGLKVYVNIVTGKESVEVTADDNIIGYVETYKSGDRLIIKMKDDIVVKGHPSINITVNARSIAVLYTSGGASIKCRDVIAGNKFTASLCGGSHIFGSIETGEASFVLNGGSISEISGRADGLTLTSSGGSIFKGYSFSAGYAGVKLAGGSITEITVNDTIDITACGGSILRYKGHATVRNQSLSGGSAIIRER